MKQPLSYLYYDMLTIEQKERKKKYQILKLLPPFCHIPVPSRPDERIDLESGRHFNSFRTVKRVANSAVIALSLILLHEITLSLLSSFHERTIWSKPSIVSNEHPSNDRDITLLESR